MIDCKKFRNIYKDLLAIFDQTKTIFETRDFEKLPQLRNFKDKLSLDFKKELMNGIRSIGNQMIKDSEEDLKKGFGEVLFTYPEIESYDEDEIILSKIFWSVPLNKYLQVSFNQLTELVRLQGHNQILFKYNVDDINSVMDKIGDEIFSLVRYL